jgi:serine O-acetyltransferase
MKLIKVVYYLTISVLYIPHLIVFILYQDKLRAEVSGWTNHFNLKTTSPFGNFLKLIIQSKEFRSVFYYRIGKKASILKWYAPGITNLYIMGEIADPLIIIHGHSTYIHPQSIGSNCRIWQNVTIGKKEQGRDKLQPVIGNDVNICAGAIVLGNIRIGNNVTIGAGAIVIKDIPNNCIVAGNPARIIKQL